MHINDLLNSIGCRQLLNITKGLPGLIIRFTLLFILLLVKYNSSIFTLGLYYNRRQFQRRTNMVYIFKNNSLCWFVPNGDAIALTDSSLSLVHRDAVCRTLRHTGETASSPVQPLPLNSHTDSCRYSPPAEGCSPSGPKTCVSTHQQGPA